MRRRRLQLIVVSIAIHVVVVFALWISSVWHIDQLDRGPDHLANLAVLDLPAPAAGSPQPKPQPDFVPKPPTHVTTDITQPKNKPADKPPEPAIGGGGTGTTGTSIGTDDDKGKCDTPPCGLDEDKKPEAKPEPPPPPPPVKKPVIVKPSDLAHIRVSGETQVHPSEVDKMAIIRAGNRGTSGLFLVCIDERGAVSSVQMKRSTGFGDYDAHLVAAIRGWRYRPYTVNGEPQPICSTVTFDYTM